MACRISVFLCLFVFVVVFSGMAAALGGPAYLVEIDLRGVEAPALRALDGPGFDGLRLAGRTAGTVFLHASAEDLGRLAEAGVEFDVIAEESRDLEYYIVGDDPGLEEALEWSEAEVLLDRRDYRLIAVSPPASFWIHRLPSKRRLGSADGPAAPLRLAEGMSVEAAPGVFTYSPAVQSMVDLVSQSRLYETVRELSGETSVTVGGLDYTIDTRYSPTQLCKVAGLYLKERFEALGLETEIHYFNFLRTLKSMHFPAGGAKGWSVGRNGVILHTEDSGGVWDTQDSGRDIALNDVFMLDDQRGCIAANGGVILHTDDGGLAWQEAATPTGADLNKVCMTGAGTAYCCGAGGVMLKSTDGGATWFSLPSGTANDLNGLAFVDSAEGWAVGDGGKIIYTTDAGLSWNDAASPTSDDLMDVTFAGALTGWISTATGKVLKTEDGASWREVETPVTTSLRSVCFAPDGLTGWAAGPSGAVVKTYDGGDTWSDISIYSEPTLWDIHFVDADEGWVCGNACLMHSTDGGLDWDNQRPNVRDGDMNIVATKPGTVSADEIYIICGHYDCTSNNPSYDAPGADDNATGTLAALEAAHVLRDYDYEATIRFICFSREEQGLVGSDAYAGMIAGRGDSVVGVLNFDMIGYVDEQPEEIEIIYDDQSVGVASAFGQAVDLYVPALDYRLRKDPGSRYSDHASFWDRGYPAFCGIEDSPPVNPYYHRTSDRIGTLDFDFYVDVVRAGVATLAEMARIDTTSAGVAARVASGRLRVLPNPCMGTVRVEYAGEVDPGMELEFYDVQGRLVGSVRPESEGGRATAIWHAQDESGRPLSPGIYFVKSAGESYSRKIILLR